MLNMSTSKFWKSISPSFMSSASSEATTSCHANQLSQLSDVEALYKELHVEWLKKNTNFEKCGQLLDKLKIGLTKLSFLPTKDGGASTRAEMLLARNILEIAVEYSVETKDIPAFERYMSQLKCYYFDYKKQIGESSNMNQILGLNLLYLLAVNRVSEFHTELELLSPDIIRSDKYIAPVLALEQYIMEGRYNKIFQAKCSAPSDTYCYFMDILMCTVRDEIAECIEKSYDKISMKEAAKRMNLKSVEDVKCFGRKRNWQLGADGIYNFAQQSEKPKEVLPSLELAEQVISYAHELEMIV